LQAQATFTGGTGSLTADLTVYYCTDDAEGLCLIEQVRVKVPVAVGAGTDTVVFTHVIIAPEG